KDHLCDVCGATLSEHTYEWQSENGKYWKKCKFCGDETAKKDIPNVTINGADAVCITQDYKFGITLPEGVTEATYGYEFENKGDLGLPAIIENNELFGIVPVTVYEPSENSFKVYAGAKTADGFEFFVSKTVALKSVHTDAEPKDHICDICRVTLSEHTGGEATCKAKAICDYCGEEYGEVDSDKHTGGTEIRDAKAATYLEEGYTGDKFCVGCGEKLSAGEVIPKLTHNDKDQDPIYDICDVTRSEHKGGTATCTEKAVCEYCHKEYGEPKGHNYREKVVEPTKFTMGGTQHICDICGDEYWDTFTKKANSEEALMPNGETIYHYCTHNGLAAETTVDVEESQTLRVFLQDPLSALKQMEDDGIKIYTITKGAEQVVASKAEKIVFRSDAPFEKFDQVMINGLVLDKKYYSVKEGSTIVTLNEDFAKEIPAGMHLFGIISTDGIAITTFTVDDKAAADNNTKSPQTGDNSHMALWIALLAASVFGLAGTAVYSKRKRVR
ncbi:MAG: hypothetical protein PUB04_02225, partial [Clostridia bacterium]|nr:hypothetical protein [Clostridia bacterium]